MKKANTKKARIKYITEGTTEYYAIEIWDNEYQEWGLCMQYPFCDEKYLYFGIVKKIIELVNLGYKFTPYIINETL